MHLDLFCTDCAQEHDASRLIRYPAELQDNGLYRLECEAGHVTQMMLQNPKFEILAELAAHAIVDGYYREAVASFTSAIERFYEFYLSVVCFKREVDPQQFLKAWAGVSVQSERQLGAYIYLHLIETNSAPALMPRKHVEFRNKVIHQGRIPTREEAIGYGQAVIDLLAPTLEDLITKYTDPLNAVIFRNLEMLSGQITDSPKYVSSLKVDRWTIDTALGSAQSKLEDSLRRINEIANDRSVGLVKKFSDRPPTLQ